jgi:hypothetical protein
MRYNNSTYSDKFVTWWEASGDTAWLDTVTTTWADKPTWWEAIQEGVEAWSRITDTMIVTGHHDDYELFTRLANTFPNLNVIPSIKISPFTGSGLSGDFFNPSKWVDLGIAIDKYAGVLGASTFLLEAESAIDRYREVSYEEFTDPYYGVFNAAALIEGLSYLPSDIDYTFYPAPWAGTESDVANQARNFAEITEVIFGELGCNFVSGDITHPYNANLIWNQQALALLEAFAGKQYWRPLIFFMDSVVEPPGSNEDVYWIAPVFDVNQLTSYLYSDNDYRCIFYPGITELRSNVNSLPDAFFNYLMPVQLDESYDATTRAYEMSIQSATNATRTEWQVKVGGTVRNIYTGSNPTVSNDILDSAIDRLKLRVDPSATYEIRVRQEYTS